MDVNEDVEDGVGDMLDARTPLDRTIDRIGMGAPASFGTRVDALITTQATTSGPC